MFQEQLLPGTPYLLNQLEDHLLQKIYQLLYFFLKQFKVYSYTSLSPFCWKALYLSWKFLMKNFLDEHPTGMWLDVSSPTQMQAPFMIPKFAASET